MNKARKRKTRDGKRAIDVLVISDLHLGTRGCHAKELHEYLKSIKPGILILNGDIIDIWQFSKRYWPNSHMKILKQILGMASKGTKVYYITGNHDETLRKFEGLKMGSFEIVNKLVLELNGKKHWFFHGDVFDVIMQHSKWLAKAGAIGYDGLIILNNIVNSVLRFFGRKKISLSKKIKESVKSSVKYINNFEVTAAQLALRKGYDVIVCGHIHHPEIRTIAIGKNEVDYMNSGDWIENLSALEYTDGCWSIYTHHNMIEETMEVPVALALEDYDNKELFRIMLDEFKSN